MRRIIGVLESRGARLAIVLAFFASLVPHAHAACSEQYCKKDFGTNAWYCENSTLDEYCTVQDQGGSCTTGNCSGDGGGDGGGGSDGGDIDWDAGPWGDGPIDIEPSCDKALCPESPGL